MYEIRIPCRYVTPRFRQLSVSVISIISILVIAAVVWLSVVFFSVEESIEGRWTDRMVAIASPVRVTPTDAYFRSYYHQIDPMSAASHFSPKNLQEKLGAPHSDPYEPDNDPALPSGFPAPHADAHGHLVDLAKVAQETIVGLKGIPGLTSCPFEGTYANFRLQLRHSGPSQQVLTQASIVTSGNPHDPRLAAAVLPLSVHDIDNLLHRLQGAQNGDLRARLFDHIDIETLTPTSEIWRLPDSFIPDGSTFFAHAIVHDGAVRAIYVPLTVDAKPEGAISTSSMVVGELQKRHGMLSFKESNGASPLAITQDLPIFIPKVALQAHYVRELPDIQFHLATTIQGIPLEGVAPIDGLEVTHFHRIDSDNGPPPLSWYRDRKTSSWVLPSTAEWGQGILLPKGFQASGALVGDQGTLMYHAPLMTQLQEMRANVYVAGFYDPGIIPVGGRLLFAPYALVSEMQPTSDANGMSGLSVSFDRLSQAPEVKKRLLSLFEEKGIAPYWKVETFEEYDFARDIFQQMKSDRNLFSLISVIIMVVACSNIVSMLIILVHDKKKEIAILRALGAKKKSIAAIFGISGLIMGAIGGIIGVLAAMLTLAKLPVLLTFLGHLQGFEVLNAAFYGQMVASSLSPSACLFVILTCSLATLISGLIPAFAACRLNVSEELRGE